MAIYSKSTGQRMRSGDGTVRNNRASIYQPWAPSSIVDRIKDEEEQKSSSSLPTFDIGSKIGASAPQLQFEEATEVKKRDTTPTRIYEEATEKAVEEPTFLERVGKTLSGAGKRSGSGFVNTQGTLFELGQGQRDRMYSDMATQYKKEYEQAQKDLSIMERENREKPGTYNDAEMRGQRYILEDAQRKYEALSSQDVKRAQQGAVKETQSIAVRLAESGQKDTERAKQGLGTVGKLAVDVGTGMTQLAADAALGTVTGLGTAGTIALRGFGSGAQQARQEGATLGQQIAYGLGTAAVEALTEKIGSVGNFNTKLFGKGAADDILEGVVAAVERAAKTETGAKFLNRLTSAGVGFLSEGVEEFVSGVVDPVLRKATYAQDESIDWKQTLQDSAYDFLVGGVIGYVMSGVGGTDTSKHAATRTNNAIDSAYDAMKQNGMFSDAGTKALSAAKTEMAWERMRNGGTGTSGTVDTSSKITYNKPVETVSPAASSAVKQTAAQAENTQLQNPESDVLDAATTAWMGLGMNLKTAKQRAEITQKLIRGEEVSVREINKLDPTNKAAQKVFSELTGVRFPDTKMPIEQTYNLFRSASTVAQTAQMAQEAAQERSQMQAAERAKVEANIAQMGAEVAQAVQEQTGKKGRSDEQKRAAREKSVAQAKRILAQQSQERQQYLAAKYQEHEAVLSQLQVGDKLITDDGTVAGEVIAVDDLGVTISGGMLTERILPGSFTGDGVVSVLEVGDGHFERADGTPIQSQVRTGEQASAGATTAQQQSGQEDVTEASFIRYADTYREQHPEATVHDVVKAYSKELGVEKLPFMGQTVTYDQFLAAAQKVPDAAQRTEAEIAEKWVTAAEYYAAQTAAGNTEASYGQGEATERGVPAQSDRAGLSRQPDAHPRVHDGVLSERSGGTAGERSQRGRDQDPRLDRSRASGDGRGGHEGAGGQLQGVSETVKEAESADGTHDFMEIDREQYDETMQRQERKFRRAGVPIRMARGGIHVKGTTRSASGLSLLGVETILQTDNRQFTTDQLGDHEGLHQYLFRDKIEGGALWKRCKAAYLAGVSKKERARLYKTYAQKYKAYYAKAKTRSEKLALREQIIEEIICDAYAGMNRDGAHAEQYQHVVKPIVDEWCAKRDAMLADAEQRYSIDSFSESMGLTFEKDGQATVFRDKNGKSVTEMTPEMVRKSHLGAVLQESVNAELLTESEMEQQLQFFSDLVNMMLKVQDIDLIWAVSATVGFQPIESGPRDPATLNQKSKFAGYTNNSDPQYSTTVDFTTICLKTQAIIDAMSATMVKLNRGLTEEEIVDVVYRNTHEAGEPVPCPVCYVFSRWVGLGGLFDNMLYLQRTYENADTDLLRRDIAALEERIDAIMAERGYAIQTGKGKKKSYVIPGTGSKKSSGDARTVLYKELMDRLNALQAKQNQDTISGKQTMSAEERAELEKLKEDTRILDNWTWLTTVRLSKNYEAVPAEILLDINRGKEFAEQYPESWKFRTTRGPAMGKAATPYADEHLGQILRGAGVGSLKDADLGNPKRNPFLKGKDGRLTADAKKALAKSRQRVKAQNLLNGQRYQSTSDFRFEYALDYLLSFAEMQALGGKVQLYTKVPESVRMFATVGAEVNCSLMPLGDGYVVNRDGSKTLVFSSVTGMNAEDAFRLSGEFDNVQPIMVGINNEHIRLCLADPRITFVIPYHASGASEGRYVALMSVVGENVEDRTDYSAYQTDHKKSNATARQKAAYDLRMRILTGKMGSVLSELDRAVLKSNPTLENLYKRFYGRDADGKVSAIDPKYLSPAARESGNLYTDPECLGVFLTSEQAKTVMPFEYWDRTSTVDSADTNGQAFADYCESLGLHPRFSGWDAKGAYHAAMDFSKDNGYWKMLIDRACYNRDGSYHEQQPINITNFSADYLLREKAVEGITQPSLVNDPAKTEKIAAKSAAEIRKRYSVAYEGTADQKQQTLLTQAKQMHRDGKSARAIREATGWWLSPLDGNWRFEIADNLMRWKVDGDPTNGGLPTKLGDLIEHEELFKAYPSLRDVEVFFTRKAHKGESGDFAPEGTHGKIYLERHLDLSSKNARQALIHEVQHAVQHYERVNGRQLQPGFSDVLGYAKAFLDAYNSIKDKRSFAALTTYAARIGAIEKEIVRQNRFRNDTHMWGLDASGVIAETADRLYRTALGEIEAEDTANRVDMGPRKRRNEPLDPSPRRAHSADPEQTAADFDAVLRTLGWSGLDSDLPAGYTAIVSKPKKAGGKANAVRRQREAVSAAETEVQVRQLAMVQRDLPTAGLDSGHTKNNDVLNQASEKSGASSLPEARYSVTEEGEDWFRQGFGAPSEMRQNQATLDALNKRYGTIPAGERAYRESQIPRSMTGKDRVSQAARTVYEAKATPAERLQTIEDVVAKGQVSDFPIENKITGNRARAKLKRDGWTKAYTDWISDVRAGKVSADLMAMGAHLLNNAGNNTEATAEQYAELFIEYAELNRNAGRSLQAARILKTLSPEGKLYGLQRYVDKMNEEAEQRASKKKGFDPEKWAKEQKITIDPELMQRYRDAKTDEERDVVMTELQQSIADQMPASLSEKLNNWRYLAMLGNFKTQGRNLIGNAMFQIPRLIKEDVRGIMEATAQLTGAKIERTTSVMRDGASFKAALNDFKDVRAIILNGGKVNEKADYLRGIDEKRRIYKNIILESYRKATNWAMDSGDALFCQFTYADSIARFMAANGITWDAAPETMREAARRRAIKEAAEATYRDSNDFSDLIARAGIRNPKNKFETVVNTLVEGILPFKKTPANILVRGLEYSPAGLLNTAFKAAQAKNADSDVTGADVINALAKTVTGTGLMALGYVLAKSGDLTGSGPDDEKEKEFWELQGGQDYSVRIGDTWLSVSFLAPEAIPVLVGANIAEQLMESDADKSAMDVVLQAFYKISDPMLELSMLSGINDMIESIEYAQQSGVVSMVANAVWSYLMQYVPSLLRQSEAASDNTRRSIYTDKNTEMPDVFQYPLGKLSQSIPGLDLYQIPYVDRWGRMENNRDSRIGNAFAQLLSPTYVSKDNTSDMEQELQRLYDATGDTAVLPREMPKKVTVDGVDYNFTGDQYVDYATLRGQYAHDALVELMDSAAYRKLSDEQKIKAVTAVYDEAADIAKQDFVDRQGLDVDGGDKDEEPKLDTGLSNAEFLAVEARVKGIESLKDKDDETIANSEGLQIMEAVYGMDLRLSDSEYEALFEALGVGKSIRKKNKGQVANALTAMRKQAK